eukprot:scaffold84622_cov72-Phaeocystis_antarctica.AAC.3
MPAALASSDEARLAQSRARAVLAGRPRCMRATRLGLGLGLGLDPQLGACAVLEEGTRACLEVLPPAWCMHGVCMVYAWAWHMHGMCMAYAWHVHGICMAYASGSSRLYATTACA